MKPAELSVLPTEVVRPADHEQTLPVTNLSIKAQHQTDTKIRERVPSSVRPVSLYMVFIHLLSGHVHEENGKNKVRI